MEMVSRGKGGGERLGLSICVGRLLSCAHPHATRSTYEARNGYKPYPNEAPGLFFTQFYSVSRSDVCMFICMVMCSR